jgi:hypothetical protein
VWLELFKAIDQEDLIVEKLTTRLEMFSAIDIALVINLYFERN